MTANTNSIEATNVGASTLAPPARFDDHIFGIVARLKADQSATPTTALLGSSSFYFWDRVAADLGNLSVRNLGFGGATVRNARLYAPQLFETYRPARLFVQLGENDIVNDAMTAERTFEELVALLDELRTMIGDIPFTLLSAKISPARMAYGEMITAFNALQKDLCLKDGTMDFIDLGTCLLGPNGLPAHRYFVGDRIHLNHEGYSRWAEVLRRVIPT